MRRPSSLPAFTLIELLVVLVILSVLAAVVGPMLAKRPGDARITTTKTQINNIKSVLAAFEIDNGRLPTTEEGLEALVVAPAGLDGTWKGPYLERLPSDSWNNAFIYKNPGADNKNYDLTSTGTDAQEGSADDITRWTK